MSEEVQTEAGRYAGRRAMKLVIEIGNDKNGTIVFAPKNEQLRGRFSAHHMGRNASSTRGILNMPDLPGMYVSLDLREGKGSIIDPLSLPEFAPTLEAASKVHQDGDVSGRGLTFRPNAVEDEMDDDRCATWLYWMMRLIRDKDARVISGECPPVGSEKQIVAEVKKVLPKGLPDKNPYDSLQGQKREGRRG